MNPKLYPREIRARWYIQVDAHSQSVSEVCRVFGISRKTYYKWYALDRTNAYKKHVSRPQPALKLTPEVVSSVVETKQRTNYGPLKMKLFLKRAWSVKVSTTVIYRLYKRRGLIRRPQKKLPWYTPLKKPVIPQTPGELVEMDTKYIWVNGQRRYQRTCVDVYTGYQFAVVLDTLEAKDTIQAFEQAQAYFPFPILAIQTDNGSEYRGVFHQYLGQQGFVHYFIPKSSPQWNGAVERAHGVIDQEFYLNPRRQHETLEEYLHWYNHERIHLGKYLNGRTPHEKYQEYLAYHPGKVSPLGVN